MLHEVAYGSYSFPRVASRSVWIMGEPGVSGHGLRAAVFNNSLIPWGLAREVNHLGIPSSDP